MGSRYSISFPCRGYNRAVRSSFSFGFDLLVGIVALGYYAYKKSCTEYHYSDSICPPRTFTRRQNKPSPRSKSVIHSKSSFEDEIEDLENKITQNKATTAQCERLAFIYKLCADGFKERYARLCAIKCFMFEHGVGHLFDSFIEAFNNSCKRPALTISDDAAVNSEYRRLLTNAMNAHKRNLSKFRHQKTFLT